MDVDAHRRLPRGQRAEQARLYALRTLARVLPLRREGLTLAECCERLNADEWLTFAGKPWTVSRMSQMVTLARRLTLDRVYHVVEAGRGSTTEDERAVRRAVVTPPRGRR